MSMTDDEASTEPSAAQRLEQYGARLNPKIDYCLERVFPKREGWLAKYDVRRRVGLINRLEPLLARLIKPNEQVLMVTKGVQSLFLERMHFGHWAATINQMAFVLTNARILIFRTNAQGAPKYAFWMVYYDQIAQVRTTLLGNLSLKLKDGKSLKFSGVPKIDRKAIRQTVEEGVAQYEQMGFHPRVTRSMETLCSYCLDCVPKGTYRCEVCGAEFWRPQDVASRNLVFPSWGDFVLEHYVVGVFKLIGYIVTLMFAALFFLIELANGNVAKAFVKLFVTLVFVHGVAAIASYFVAHKGLHPRRPPTRRPRPPIAEDVADAELEEEAETGRSRGNEFG